MKIFLIVMFCFSGLAAFPCSTCGCAMTGNFIGIMPQNQKNFIGIHLWQASFAENSYEGNFNTRYRTAKIAGGIKIRKWWQVAAVIPYLANEYKVSNSLNDDGVITHNGIGDIAVSNTFTVYSTSDSLMKKVRQNIALNAGVELPTGHFNPDYNIDDEPASISTGSGSFDINAGVEYVVQIKRWSIRADYNFKMNLPNPYHYDFGDQHTADVYVSKMLSSKKCTFSPYAGILFESSGPDYHYTFVEEGSGGKAVFATAGIETNMKSFNIGVNASYPITGKFGAMGGNAQSRFSIYGTYLF